MNPDQRESAPENAANAEILNRLSAELNARPWDEVRAGIPHWHPRMDEDPGTPTAEADAAPPDTGDQQQDQAPELPFKLDDITDDFTLTGEEARKWLLGRQAQLQAPVTRRQQELAQQAEQYAVYAELEQKLNDPSTSLEAVMAFAKRAGIDLEVDGEDEEDDAEEYTDPLEKEVAELRAWREQQEQEARTAAETAARTEAERQFDDHAVSEMTRIAAAMGTTLDELPDEDRDDIVARALVAPTLANGLPDFDAGLAQHLAYKEYVAKLEAEKYTASKTGGMNPGVNGGSGSSVVDLRDTNQRLAAAMTAADKHYSTS